ncbi:MAG: ribonuclease III [Firmicutes bacterium]|nr:ribonuclease III [Bacillota bacterium]
MATPYKNTAKLLKFLSWPVQNEELYQEALTHSSYAYEIEGLCSNERLEFLGDAALELIMSAYFFEMFPDASEGRLTLMRHNVVNEKTLAKIARDINLGMYIKLGKGEFLSGGAEKASVLADALEALIGALFLDQGYQASVPLVIDLFKPVLKAVKQGNFPLMDYKTMLQEICQSKGSKPPVYQITAEYGPPHDKAFEAVVKLDSKIKGVGTGKSKKEAEQSAAKAAWELIEL